MMHSECEEGCIETEIEALKSIYVHELEVEYAESDQPTTVAVHLHPATGENIEKQFVRLTLVLKLSSRYPEEIPAINIRNPRGLSDDKLELLFQNLTLKAEESKGHQSLYELIEVAKEHLTVQNTPSCPCAICLYHFTEEDVFTKTECYHYFHCYCLSRYIHHCLAEKKEEEEASTRRAGVENKKIEIVCPVCRTVIDYKSFSRKTYPVPKESEQEQDFKVTSDLRKQQEWMAFLFEKQRAKGSIIDVEMEKNKLLLEISTTSRETMNNNTTSDSKSLEIHEPSVSAARDIVDEEETLHTSKDKKNVRKPANPKSRKLENFTDSQKSADSTYCSERKAQLSADGNNVCGSKTKKVLPAVSIVDRKDGCPDVTVEKCGVVERVCGEHYGRKKTYEKFKRSGAREPRNWYSEEKDVRAPRKDEGYCSPVMQVKSYRNRNRNIPCKGYPSNDCSAKADGEQHNNDRKPFQNKKSVEDCHPTSNTVEVNISQNNAKFEDTSQNRKKYNNKFFNCRVRNFEPHRARFGHEFHFNRHKNRYPPHVYGSRSIPEEKPNRKQFQSHQDISLGSDKSMNLTEKDAKNDKRIESNDPSYYDRINSRTPPLSKTVVQPYTRGFRLPPGFSRPPPGFERR
ncbi:uncharacterized protein LOC106464452 [Limulus polyphemus]|uniref:Uncharacterized protein LOC106464452 n=1 Tax=Limulus polyphemus TaxID=6850 RepID=A0ABM1BDY4_LIMPO|nr:uncharacterized protein LOC106464452 [Limulus polyphemus]